MNIVADDRDTSMSPVRQAPDATQLALDRAWLAYERTLMAWNSNLSFLTVCLLGERP